MTESGNKDKNNTNISFDESKSKSSSEKVFGDVSRAYTTIMCRIGDKLNLFKKLESNGPASSMELAKLADIDERYLILFANDYRILISIFLSVNM
ncbi:MAG: hypothetical protein L0H53_02380, partial [Candidatus Nitrosocosmicus sp.]|nr:hypothetical protein [Candidatus Nitrosocosmicus sp.]